MPFCWRYWSPIQQDNFFCIPERKLHHWHMEARHQRGKVVHIAPRGAKKEEAFGGVILKSERPSGALFTNSGPPFFTVESKIEVLSPLGTSFH